MSWKKDSYRHGLASKGVRTKQMKMKTCPQMHTESRIRMDSVNEVAGKLDPMYANGFFASVKNALSGAVEKVKEKVTGKTKEERKEEKRKGTEEAEKKRTKKSIELEEKKVALQQKKRDEEFQRKEKEDIKQLKKETGIRGKAGRLLDSLTKEEEEERKDDTERADNVGRKPSPDEVDIKKRGRLGALWEQASRDSPNPPPEEFNDVTDELLTSPDADAIIEVAEEKQKLINFANVQSRNISTLEDEYDRLRDEFRASEDEMYKKYRADERLAREEALAKIENIETSTLSDAKKEHKVETIKIDFNKNVDEQRARLKDFKRRNETTLDAIEVYTDDLKNANRQVRKRIGKMTASGKPR